MNALNEFDRDDTLTITNSKKKIVKLKIKHIFLLQLTRSHDGMKKGGKQSTMLLDDELTRPVFYLASNVFNLYR